MIATIKKILQQKTRAKYFAAVSQWQKQIFLILAQRDYFDKRYFYEKKLHNLRLHLMKVMQKARMVLVQDEINLLECIYELLFSLSHIRLRIFDHTTFEVCEQEFAMLTQELTVLLKNFMRARPSDTLKFGAAIEALEVINQNALQVVTYDPIVLMIFLQNLRELQKKLLEFADRMHDE